MNRSTLYIVVIALLSSCGIFKKAPKLSRIDSTKVEVPYVVVVPKDSIVTSFRYDTLHTIIVEKQGRAKLTIQRIDSFLRVQADCNPVVIKDTVYINVGNKSVYEKPLTWWEKTWWWIKDKLLVLLLILVAYNIFVQRK